VRVMTTANTGAMTSSVNAIASRRAWRHTSPATPGGVPAVGVAVGAAALPVPTAASKPTEDSSTTARQFGQRGSMGWRLIGNPA
jgi:hypothetical protein